MVYHFVNLVSWKTVSEISSGSKVAIDSISLALISKLFGYHFERRSGVAEMQSIDFSSMDIVLSAKEGVWGRAQTFVLPFVQSVEEMDFDVLLKAIANSQRVFLGISSPKQDILAKKLEDKFPDKEYYCLGAALYVSFNSDRFTWFFFLFEDPRRTLKKLFLTFRAFLEIIVNPVTRSKFRTWLVDINQEL